jgi:uncharacterized membrane protein YphA (DoxX/SURF4 family)
MNSDQKMSKTLNFFLWIAQGLLAATFLWAGFMKIFKPEALPWAWIKENPNLVTTTGILDLLAGIGIVFPTLLRIRPILTVFAAYGIIALMLSASIFHIARGEAKDIGFNVFVALLAGFVAWGRR